MPIVPSHAGRIQDLLTRLASPVRAERDSAVAGLRLLGSRAIEPLGTFIGEASASAREAALEVVEALDDRRVLPLLLALGDTDDEAVATRALEAAAARADARAVRPLAALMMGARSATRRSAAALALVRLQAAGVVDALDPLVTGLLDEAIDPRLRLAVLDAIADLDPPVAPGTLRPLLDRLARSSAPTVAARASRLRRSARPRGQKRETNEDLLERLLDPRTNEAEAPGLAAALSGSAAPPLARLRAALEAARGPRPIARLVPVLEARGERSIPVLLDALERVGNARATRADAAAAEARAAIHRALAALDSRAALFDLREAIESRPVSGLPSLVESAGRIGDARLLPALARTVVESPGLLEPCSAAFTAIVRREGLRRTARRPRVERPEHRAAFDALWARAKRERGRRAPRR